MSLCGEVLNGRPMSFTFSQSASISYSSSWVFHFHWVNILTVISSYFNSLNMTFTWPIIDFLVFIYLLEYTPLPAKLKFRYTYCIIFKIKILDFLIFLGFSITDTRTSGPVRPIEWLCVDISIFPAITLFEIFEHQFFFFFTLVNFFIFFEKINFKLICASLRLMWSNNNSKSYGQPYWDYFPMWWSKNG